MDSGMNRREFIKCCSGITGAIATVLYLPKYKAKTKASKRMTVEVDVDRLEQYGNRARDMRILWEWHAINERMQNGPWYISKMFQLPGPFILNNRRVIRTVYFVESGEPPKNHTDHFTSKELPIIHHFIERAKKYGVVTERELDTA